MEKLFKAVMRDKRTKAIYPIFYEISRRPDFTYLDQAENQESIKIDLQFTGREDKKGNKVFEEDLVKAKKGNSSLGVLNDVYEVTWDNNFSQWVLLCVQSDNNYRVGKVALKQNNQPFLLSNVNEILPTVKYL